MAADGFRRRRNKAILMRFGAEILGIHWRQSAYERRVGSEQCSLIGRMKEWGVSSRACAGLHLVCLSLENRRP